MPRQHASTTTDDEFLASNEILDEDGIPTDSDLSPLSVLLLGCLISAVVFSVVRRILNNAAEASRKQKLKRRRLTREEEEAIVDQQMRQEQAQPLNGMIQNDANVAEQEEEKVQDPIELLSIHELKERISQLGGDYSDCFVKEDLIARLRELTQEEDVTEEEDINRPLGEGDVSAEGIPYMSKKDLHKVEKKKKKQEQQEAWRYHLERERRLRELREAEEREREEAAREEEEEPKRKFRDSQKTKPLLTTVTDEELVTFVVHRPEREVYVGHILKRFPHVPENELVKQLERLCISRSKLPLLVITRQDSIRKADEADLGLLRDTITARGSMVIDELIFELQKTLS